MAVARRLRIESEFLADETALRQTNDAPALARSLVSAASALHINRTFSPIPAMAGGDASLSKRTLNMFSFDPKSSKSRPGLFSCLSVVIGLMVIGWFSPRAGVTVDRSSPDALVDGSMHLEVPALATPADTTVVTTITWSDGQEYEVRLTINTSGQESYAEGAHLVIDFDFVDDAPKQGDWRILFRPSVDSDMPSARQNLERDSKLRAITNQVFEIADRHGVVGLDVVTAHLDDYSMLLIGSTPQLGEAGYGIVSISEEIIKVAVLPKTLVKVKQYTLNLADVQVEESLNIKTETLKLALPKVLKLNGAAIVNLPIAVSIPNTLELNMDNLSLELAIPNVLELNGAAIVNLPIAVTVPNVLKLNAETINLNLAPPILLKLSDPILKLNVRVNENFVVKDSVRVLSRVKKIEKKNKDN